MSYLGLVTASLLQVFQLSITKGARYGWGLNRVDEGRASNLLLTDCIILLRARIKHIFGAILWLLSPSESEFTRFILVYNYLMEFDQLI